MLVDKQNQKLKTRFINYEKANKAYVIENKQLQSENKDLESQLADLEKQLKIARLDKHSTLFSLLPPPPASVVSDDSDDNSKQSKKKKSIKLSDPFMLTDSHATKFNIDVWESKIVKKLTANADHYPTKALRIVYVDSHVDREAYKHLAARSRIGARKPFATTEEMFKVLQKTYGNVNQ